MIECSTKINDGLKLRRKSRSRNLAPLFTLIEVLTIKKCSMVPGSTCKNLVKDQMICEAGGSGGEKPK